MNEEQRAEIERLKSDHILTPLESAEELSDWFVTYLGLDFPRTTVYPDSTHSPIEAAWRIYYLLKTGESQDVPQISMLASRDSFKTLLAAALEVLCMCHFRISVAHGAAIKSQSAKAVQYVNSFFRKIGVYLEANGWEKNSDSKEKIEWITDEGEDVYLRVLVATVAGMNCIDPDAVVEAKSGPKFAKNIEIGEKILTYDYIENKEKYVTVKNSGYTVKESRKISFSDNTSIIVSDDHQVFTQRGWITADQVKVGYKMRKKESQSIYKSFPKKIKYINLDLDFEQMVLGTLLGDASINILPSGSCRYQVSHCEEQSDYIFKIKEIFELNNIKCNIYQDPTTKQFKLTTQVHEYFKKINFMIKNSENKKRPNGDWVSLIKEEAIAYLVMDDGSVNSKYVGKNKQQPINISTFDFSKEENELLAKRITDLGYPCSVFKKGKYFGIKLTKDASRDLSYKIRPYFVDSLKYKLLPPKSHKQFTRYIDTGNVCIQKGEISCGYSWEVQDPNLKYARNLRKTLKENVKCEVVSIEIVGRQELIDLEIESKNEHLKSFYANNILVHNSEHVPLLFIDEVDVVQDPRALEEAKMVPTVYKGFFPLTVYLSTRKFAGGLMEKTLEETITSGGEILRWNILDITGRIPDDIALKNKPMVRRYITSELPMSNISPGEYDQLSPEDKKAYEPFDAYAGIAEHPMLSVMRNYLADRPDTDEGGLYKPVRAVLNNFKQTKPDWANAQLLCNKPSSYGLVFPRFSTAQNVLSVEKAYFDLTGTERPGCTLDYLIDFMHQLGIEFFGGVDWGFTDEGTIMIGAKIPNGDVWVIDMVSESGLELDDMLKYAKEFDSIYKVKKWYCDSNYPANIKTFNNSKNGLSGKAVGVKKTKDFVNDSITSVQGAIVDSTNYRKLKVIKHSSTQRVIDCFGVYKWKTDGKGDPIDGVPEHGKDGTADVMDALRYFVWGILGKIGGIGFSVAGKEEKKDGKDWKTQVQEHNSKAMSQKVASLATGGKVKGSKSKKKGGIIFSV